MCLHIFVCKKSSLAHSYIYFNSFKATQLKVKEKSKLEIIFIIKRPFEQLDTLLNLHKKKEFFSCNLFIYSLTHKKNTLY